jgi:hypothetical protein
MPVQCGELRVQKAVSTSNDLSAAWSVELPAMQQMFAQVGWFGKPWQQAEQHDTSKT